MLVILIYLFWKYAVRLCIRVCTCCCQTDVADKLIRSQNVRSNFYSCISFRTLRQELYMAQTNVNLFKNMKKTGHYVKQNMSEEDLEEYIGMLEQRVKQVEE